mmetsp:Transcript_16069/g.36877  ORF Transcript_16069/g.36877 Transcript_16069/m.36877 type:complete len:693 (+) Transcript_16069:97-2175(+)
MQAMAELMRQQDDHHRCSSNGDVDQVEVERVSSHGSNGSSDRGGRTKAEEKPANIFVSRSSWEEPAVDETKSWSPLRRIMKLILESKSYELVLAFVIVANAAVIIKEVDLRAKGKTDELLKSLGYYFLAFYAVEVSCRLIVYRMEFFDLNWNLADLAIVVLDLLAIVVDVTLGTDEIPSLGVLRMVRLGRLARFVHVLMIFKELHMMLHAFLSALRTIVWASVMLSILITLCSIVAVEVVHPINLDVVEKYPHLYEGCDRCSRAFESVWSSNLTFIQTIIAGDSWGTLAVPIIEEAWYTGLILVSALVTINLGVLNLILTVIVNAAQEARMSDEKLLAQERGEKYRKLQRRLLRICSLLDEDQDGVISLDDMYKALETNPEFRASLEAMDIGYDDMEIFFSFVDTDGSGDVTYSEFVEQVFKLKSQDSVAMIVSIKGLIAQMNKNMGQNIKDLQDHMSYIARSMRRSGVVSSIPPRIVAMPADSFDVDRQAVEEVSRSVAPTKQPSDAMSIGYVGSDETQDSSWKKTGSELLFGKSRSQTAAPVRPWAVGQTPRCISDKDLGSQGSRSGPSKNSTSLVNLKQQVSDMRVRLDNDLAVFVEEVMSKIEGQIIARLEEPQTYANKKAAPSSDLLHRREDFGNCSERPGTEASRISTDTSARSTQPTAQPHHETSVGRHTVVEVPSDMDYEVTDV